MCGNDLSTKFISILSQPGPFSLQVMGQNLWVIKAVIQFQLQAEFYYISCERGGSKTLP